MFASGSVVTSLRTAYGAGTTSVDVVDASQFAAGDTILISNLSQGHTITVTAVDTTNNRLTLVGQKCGTINWPGAGQYPAGSLVIRALRARFTVAPVDGIPTLMMDPDGPNGPAVAEPLAEGIEDLQIALGVDVNGDGLIDPATEWAYDTAAHGALVGPVLAVKVVLVARATTIISGGTTPFVRPAALDHAAAASNDVYRRRVLTSTVELRNMGGSP